jgi:hypothetical protein
LAGHTPAQFGAERGRKWQALAIRRFLLYGVFLHELGHLQYVEGRSGRLACAGERLGQEFAVAWRDRLWSEPFLHPDPAHNPPHAEEILSSSQC